MHLKKLQKFTTKQEYYRKIEILQTAVARLRATAVFFSPIYERTFHILRGGKGLEKINLIGNTICIKPGDKILSVVGDSNSKKLCFVLDRYVGELDLSLLKCIIKLSNTKKITDIASLQVVASEKTLDVIWTIGENATSQSGLLEIQLEFHNSESKTVWQSNIAEFIIERSLPADRIFEQKEPTIFEQWEARIDARYDEFSEQLDDLIENGLPGIGGDASSLNGKRVDDTKFDNLSLWTAEKTKAEIDSGISAISTASTTRNGFMSKEDKVRLDTMQSVTAQEKKRWNDYANSLFRAAATYENGIFLLDIIDKPANLPENFQVTFIPPTDFHAGDKIRINGVANLKNLYKRSFNNPPDWFYSHEATKLSNGYVRFCQTTLSEYIDVFSVSNAAALLKPNTTYTFVADVTENTVSGSNFILAHSTLSDDCFSVSATLNATKGTGVLKLKTTTDADLTGKKSMRITMTASVLGAITLRVMLLEGDWTAKAIPSGYWENTYGEFEILPYGLNAAAFTSGVFAAGQPVTLNVGLGGAYFK